MTANIINFPEQPEEIVFACSKCNNHHFIVSLERTGLIVCSECGQEHSDGIKWVYKADS